MHSYYLIQDLAIIGVAAMIVTWIFGMLKMPLLLGYILVGILVSPVFNMLHESKNIVQMGDLGVMFMMFFIGMEFNFERLKKVMFSSIFGISFQIIIMLIFGLFTARCLGLSETNGLFLGAIISMSSTIVLVEMLTQRKELGQPFAQVAVGILILEDLFAIVLMVILSTLGGGSKLDFFQLAQRSLILSAFVVSVYIFGKLSVPWLIRKFALSRNPQVVIMFVFCFMLGLGQLAVTVELSTSLGAFLAGSILSGTAMSAKIENLTNSFRNLFIALFFVSVGTMIEPHRIFEMWLPIVLISGVVIVLKIFSTWLGVVLGGTDSRTAYLAAVNKAQIGEFSFVISSLGIQMGILDSSILVISMGVSFITVFLNPFISADGERSANFIAKYSPAKFKLALNVYQRTLGVVLAAAHKNNYMQSLIAPLIKTGIYFLLFCGVVIGAALVCEYTEISDLGQELVFRRIVLIVGAALSLPLVIGFVMAVREFVTIAIIGLRLFPFVGLIKIKEKLIGFMRTIFSSLAILLVGGIYFIVFLYYFPYRDSILIYFLMVAFVALVARKFIIGINENLEYSFKRIFRRHIENAEHHQREIMLEHIKSNYAWLGDIYEVEIPELSLVGGRTVSDISLRHKTGAEILAIKRGRFVVYDVLPETRIFPDDTLILSGEKSSLKATENMLCEQISDFDAMPYSDKVLVKCLSPQSDSLLLGKTLASANVSRLYAVKIMGIIRNGENKYSRPNPSDIFKLGDKIYAMGLEENLQKFIFNCGFSISSENEKKS